MGSLQYTPVCPTCGCRHGTLEDCTWNMTRAEDNPKDPAYRPPLERITMNAIYCKGSISLGTGCGKCPRCKEEIEAGVKPINKLDRVPMQEIPVSAAERIAKTYGYDQVVIMARRIDNALPPVNADTAINTGREEGEHITTYGVNKTHCSVAALMGSTLKRIARWPSEADRLALDSLYDQLLSGAFDYMDYDAACAEINALGRLLGK